MLLAGICCISTFAEEGNSRTVVGKVLDNSGFGLPGVTILQKTQQMGQLQTSMEILPLMYQTRPKVLW